MKASKLATILPAALALSASVHASDTLSFDVTVESDHQQISDAQVSLWYAQAGQSPVLMAEGKSGHDGQVSFSENTRQDEGVYYLTAKGGTIQGKSVEKIPKLGDFK